MMKFKKLIPAFIACMLFACMMPAAAFAAGGTHIDIDVRVTATAYINGTLYEKIPFKLTTADANNITVTREYNGSVVTLKPDGCSTTTDSNEIRLDFNKQGLTVGTKAKPYYYTVTLEKTITVYIQNGQATTTKPTRGTYSTHQIPVVLSVTTDFWHNNYCPGVTRWTNQSKGEVSENQNPPGKSGKLDGNAIPGMDVKLGDGNTANGELTIWKDVEGVNLTQDKTYSFNIKSGNTVYKTVNVTVKAGQTSGSLIETLVPFGTYTIEEVASSAQINGYNLTTTYPHQSDTISVSDRSGSLVVKNSYVTADKPDPNYVKVQKTFAGITDPSLIKNDFAVTISKDGKSYKLNKSSYNWKQTGGGTEDVVWTWEIENADTGTYKVAEEKEDIAGYDVTKEGLGDITIEPATMNFNSLETHTTCARTDWDVDIDSIFLGSLTHAGSQTGGIVVCSKESLSASQRAAVVEYIRGSGHDSFFNGSTWQKGDIHFYSYEVQGDKYVIAGGSTVTYSFDEQQRSAKYVYSDKDIWQQVAIVNYDMNIPVVDIAVKNTYKPKVGDLKVSKTITGNAADPNKHYTVKLTGLKASTSYDAEYNATAQACAETAKHTAKVTADASGNATVELCSNEEVTIKGIAENTKVKAVETGLKEVAFSGVAIQVNNGTIAKYGYLGDGSQGKSYADYVKNPTPVEATIKKDASQAVKFTNNITEEPSTGFGLEVLPFVAVLVAAVAGMGAFLYSSRRRLTK